MRPTKTKKSMAHPKGFEPLTPRFVVFVKALKDNVFIPLIKCTSALISPSQNTLNSVNLIERTDPQPHYDIFLRDKEDDRVILKSSEVLLENAMTRSEQYMRNRDPKTHYVQIWAVEFGSNNPPILIEGDHHD